ncbi:MAG: hypothetical protein ABEJ57_03470 [Halobacteriaceae archaeon]
MVVLNGGASGTLPPLVVVVAVLAAIGTAGVLGVALAAYVRRRERSYLLVVLAIAALLGRSLVTVYTYGFAGLSTGRHHLIEHGFDVVFVVLVIAAVYYARSVAPAAEVDP